MRSRRLFGITVVALLVVGGGMFLAASRTWATGRVATDGLPSDIVEVTGSDAQPIVAALSLVVAAAGLAVLSTRGRLRQAIGAIATAAAVAVAVLVLTGRSMVEAAFDDAVTESAAFTGGQAPPIDHSVWPWVVGALAVIATALGALTVVNARSWPTMSGRYDAPKSSTTQDVDAAESDGSDVWKALDEGRDPTA